MLAVDNIIKLGEEVRDCLQSPATFEVLVTRVSESLDVEAAMGASILLACYSYTLSREDSFRDFIVHWIEDVVDDY